MFEEARCVRCHTERPVELAGQQPGPAMPMQAHHEDAPETGWAFGTWAVIGLVISIIAIIEKVKRKPTAEP